MPRPEGHEGSFDSTHRCRLWNSRQAFIFQSIYQYVRSHIAAGTHLAI